MPQVPYTPYPTANPSAQGPARVNISTPLDAFGGNIAQAVEGLGKVTEHAGNELFARAVALQQLNNETEAKDADAKYMIAAGELHANYSALQGKDAVDAYPKYAKDLEEARIKLRGSLSNPAAQKMYDGSSLSTMGRSIFNGAGHAATANKQYVIGTATSAIDLDAKTVEDNPQDERLYQEKRARIQENARVLAGAKGFPPGSPMEEDLALKATSKLRSQQIIGLSRVAPFEAAARLDQFKTELTQDDYLRTDNTVRAQGRAVGSVGIANEIYDPEKPLKALEDEARERAKKVNPDDPLLAQHAVAAVQGKYNQDRAARRQEEATNLQTVDGAIGQGVKDIQQLRADPKVATAIDALPKDKQLAIPGKINRYNAARDKISNEDNYQRLYGIMNNDVEAFLNTDITQEKLSQPDIRKFQVLQHKLKDNPNQDPRVDRAKGILKGAMGAQLEALGIYRRTEANKDDYDHYTGALSVALDSWMDEHKKPPTAKDLIDTIGPQVIQQRAEPGWLWGTNQKPFFTQSVPDKFSTQLKADMASKELPEPTEQQVYRAWLQLQYGKYGKSKSEFK